MTTSDNFPSIEELKYGLRLAVWEEGIDGSDLKVMGRRPNLHSSTFPSEIVSCQLSDGQQIDLFCKYSADTGNEAFGHRGGVAYEADVHKLVLRSLQLTLPRLLAVYNSEKGREKWLITEYLPNSMKVMKVPVSTDPEAMIKAVRWIGNFHQICSGHVSDAPYEVLNRYDIKYFAGWSDRTYQFAVRLNLQSNWLKKLCLEFPKRVEVLLDGEQTIIHGEYYPENILFSEGKIYPLDWETSAISAGEIDIATLTEDWPAPDMRRFELEYEQSRWGGVAPTDHSQALAMSRLYLQFRWLGDNPDWGPTKVGNLYILEKDAHLIGIL